MLPRGALVVSCQARADNPLHGASHMAAMARAAVEGGARAIRANGVDDVAAIRVAVATPIIGLLKRFDPAFPVYITPRFADAAAVSAAGADIVAVDATMRPRDGEPAHVLIRRIRDELGREVLADVDGVEPALAAARAGATYVASTLAGYTDARPRSEGPDFDLLAELLAACDIPVVAEGRFDTPAQVARAFAMGAHAVVVGTAITNPREITRRFARACPL